MGRIQQDLLGLGCRIGDDLERQLVAALRTSPCRGSFLTGAAGAGKTFLAESVAQVEGCSAFFFQAFPGCRKEELFQTILPDASQPSGFRTLAGVLPQAAEASHKGKTALILDEWDKTHPSTDAFLLDFLQTGRVSVPGSQVRAAQEKLVVFVTLNNERELSEPLLRRLPLIELPPATPELVAAALHDTHPGHPYLHAALTLYRRSLLANLSKPATIQELRQLLDAITLLEGEADWNRLVFQFVTKNWDDHELLKSAESLPLDPGFAGLERDDPELSPERYEAEELTSPNGAPMLPRMPRVRRDWLERIPAKEMESEPSKVFGVVPAGEAGYDGVARAVLQEAEPELSINHPADLGLAQVGETEIVVFRPLDFTRIDVWAQILKDGGELLLEARHEGEISREMLAEFKAGLAAGSQADGELCRIYSLTDEEMLMRYRTVKIRWTPESLEVVAREFDPARELWEALYGERGLVIVNRTALARLEHPSGGENGQPANEQLGEDYLYVLREFQHMSKWFSLLINRNLRVWGRVTCDFQDQSVQGSILPLESFNPANENPASKEEADAITIFNTLTEPALDYYDSQLTHIESDLTHFVAKNGEFPPAVEDGGIFALHEIHTDISRIKREGMKLYMRKSIREA